MARPVAGRRRWPDLKVSTWVFLFIGSFVGTLSLIYLLTDDDAGQMMLGVTSLFGLYIGGFFWLRRRKVGRRSTEVGHPAPAAEEHYLPHSSVWPFVVGAAAFLLSNGLVLGVWFLVPGGILLLAGLIGFGLQSIRRE